MRYASLSRYVSLIKFALTWLALLAAFIALFVAPASLFAPYALATALAVFALALAFAPSGW